MLRTLLVTLVTCLVFQIKDAHALRFSVSAFANYANTYDRDYEHFDSSPVNLSLGYGVSHKFDNNLIVGVSTNRFLNPKISSSLRSKQTGNYVTSTSRITSDSFFLAYKINRFAPVLSFSNINVENKKYSNNSLIESSSKSSILTSCEIAYFLGKQVVLIQGITLPNKELGLRYSYSIGISYFF